LGGGKRKYGHHEGGGKVGERGVVRLCLTKEQGVKFTEERFQGEGVKR